VNASLNFLLGLRNGWVLNPRLSFAEEQFLRAAQVGLHPWVVMIPP
jgi:hypothetical protein